MIYLIQPFSFAIEITRFIQQYQKYSIYMWIYASFSLFFNEIRNYCMCAKDFIRFFFLSSFQNNWNCTRASMQLNNMQKKKHRRKIQRIVIYKWRIGYTISYARVFLFFFPLSWPRFNSNQTIHISDHDKYFYHLVHFIFCWQTIGETESSQKKNSNTQNENNFQTT